MLLLIFLATVPAPTSTFYRSPPGRFTVIVGALWAAFGWVLMRVIARQQEEPRVLGGASAAVEGRSSLPLGASGAGAALHVGGGRRDGR